MKLEQLTCKRCGYQWKPRIEDVVQCPNPRCKSAKWKQPKEVK